MKRVAVFLIFLVIGTGIYFNSLKNEFHFDDWHHIFGNSYIKTLENVPLFFVEPRTFSVRSTFHRHYRPLVMTSYAINYYFGGLDRPGYHILNLAFHIGSAFLIFLILQAMLPATSFVPLAAGLLFLTTPYNTEVVNYIAARSTVMCAFFYLLSFYFWVKYRSQKSEVRSQKKSYFLPITSYFYLSSLFAFLLAMLTKEIAITLPVMLILYDLYFHKKGVKRWTVYIPFAFVGAFVGILLRRLFFGSFITEREIDPLTHFIVAIKVLAKYFSHMAIPVNLSVEHPILEAPNIYFFLSFILLASLFILFYIFWRSRDLLLHVSSFLIAWFFIVLLPTTFIALTAPYQENRGYLSSAGFAALMAVGMDKLIKRASAREYIQTLAGYSLIGILIIAFSAGTVMRNRVWLDDSTLWSDVVKKYPQSKQAHGGLGTYYVLNNQMDKAEAEYRAVLEIDPENAQALTNLGIIHMRKNEMDKAEELFRKALEFNPLADVTNFNMAKILQDRGNLHGAVQHLLRALMVRPDSLDASVKLIDLYTRMGKLDEAYKRVASAKEKDPDNPGIRRALGLIYMKQEKWKEAAIEFEAVLKYMPGDLITLIDLGNVYFKQGLAERAEKQFLTAMRIDPTKTYQNLGIIYQKQGRYDDALDMYKKALEVNPKSSPSLNNIGLLYFKKGDNEKALAAFKMALEISPSYHIARINMAKLYESQSRTDLARNEYRLIIEDISANGGDRGIFLKAKERLAALK